MKSTIPLTLCESTNIAGYGYDESTNTLAIRFKSGPGGTTYHYANVPPYLFAALCGAGSKGSFFIKQIKFALDTANEPIYPATQMKPEEPDDEDGDIPMPVQPTPKNPPQHDDPHKIDDPAKEAA